MSPVVGARVGLEGVLLEASRKGIFIVNDFPVEASSVGRSMAQGREAAQRVHEYLMGLRDRHVSLYDRYYTERTKPKAYRDMLLGTDDVRLPP